MSMVVSSSSPFGLYVRTSGESVAATGAAPARAGDDDDDDDGAVAAPRGLGGRVAFTTDGCKKRPRRPDVPDQVDRG